MHFSFDDKVLWIEGLRDLDHGHCFQVSRAKTLDWRIDALAFCLGTYSFVSGIDARKATDPSREAVDFSSSAYDPAHALVPYRQRCIELKEPFAEGLSLFIRQVHTVVVAGVDHQLRPSHA